MTEPSQYFKGRTVQEQMDEVIGYVDKRAEEVAAAKADSVLQPAEDAKTAAQAAAQQAEAAKDTTLAALPEIRQDISGLKAEDVALDGRLNTVELKVQTAEGNIVTIQGQITAIENKNTQQDSAITALQTADEQNVKLTGANGIGTLAVLLTDNQDVYGIKNMKGSRFKLSPEGTNAIPYIEMTGKYTAGTPNTYEWFIQCKDVNGNEVGDLILSTDSVGNSQLLIALRKSDGTTVTKTIATVN